MNNKIHFGHFCLLSFFFATCIGCSKDEKVNSEFESFTEEFVKIETIYQGGDFKIETNEVNQSNVEDISYAPFSYKEKVRLELENNHSKTTTYLKSTNELYGVFRNGSCGKYHTLSVYLDNEDSNNGTNSEGWIGSSYTK